jgi:hypothetical protein
MIGFSVTVGGSLFLAGQVVPTAPFNVGEAELVDTSVRYSDVTAPTMSEDIVVCWRHAGDGLTNRDEANEARTWSRDVTCDAPAGDLALPAWTPDGV